MIQNVFETDFKESLELVSYNMVLNVLFLGILPLLAIFMVKIKYPNKIFDYIKFYLYGLLALVIFTSIIFFQYKTFVSVFRNHKDIIFRIIPNNFINGIYQNVILMLPTENKKQISSEAHKNKSWKNHKNRAVFVFVIGEAARADHFSLNGYSKETNPNLKKQGVINFENFYSCGTSTAVSVPCMFSSLDKANFSKQDFKYNDNLVDLIKKSGFKVLWVENNGGGCKSVCDNINTIQMQSVEVNNSINNEIFDEEMLKILKDFINNNKKDDLFIVLHQMGSHGPAYYKRTPKKFQQFQPICDSIELQKCSSEEIKNSYDNTILYTDYFLSEIIEILKEKTEVNTAMFYVSDHGQSLGEKGIYLHGMPYLIAPKNQKHIPMLMWLSKNFTKEFNLDTNCLESVSNNHLSHDNLFHSILDLLKIDTNIKNQKFIFNHCN
ncbi:Phosphoethanolamine transferase EptA [Rickettsiales endosymbiont of Trichoplax sp. H2]|nr:Phosphoethanolamine transferase EptA [Rickettsiales endosymbiont of Trichoplax sp. H2]